MEILDATEYARWIRAADQELQVARLLVEAEMYNSAVLHAEQAAQLLLKGLLRGVGRADLARGSHALHGLADAAARDAAMVLEPEHRDALMALSRGYQPSRYPDAVASGTPRENYGATHAQQGLGVAETTRAAVEAAWQALEQAAAEQESARDQPTPPRSPTSARSGAWTNDGDPGGRPPSRGAVCAAGRRPRVRRCPAGRGRGAVGAVFGSVARGDFHSDSDIDVLVVALRLPQRSLDR